MIKEERFEEERPLFNLMVSMLFMAFFGYIVGIVVYLFFLIGYVYYSIKEPEEYEYKATMFYAYSVLFFVIIGSLVYSNTL